MNRGICSDEEDLIIFLDALFHIYQISRDDPYLSVHVLINHSRSIGVANKACGNFSLPALIFLLAASHLMYSYPHEAILCVEQLQ